MKNLLKKKQLLTGILAALGTGIILIYNLCENSCRYLKGSIWGIDLTYLGLFLLAITLLLSFLKKETLLLALLSFALGGEIFLIGYQVVNALYCPFCLAFAAVVVLMLIVNFDKRKIPLMLPSAILGLIFFLLSFTGSLTPAYAEENLIVSFGSGTVKVRLYTDYFCDPCRAAEPEIESLLTALMAKNSIRLTFIDTPIHKETPLYARYFLYILNGDPTFHHALLARSALYEAAAMKISTSEALESSLAKKGFTFKPFDVAPVFKVLQSRISEDKINGTPSCTISGRKGKERFLGGPGVIKGLKAIMEAISEKAAPSGNIPAAQ